MNCLTALLLPAFKNYTFKDFKVTASAHSIQLCTIFVTRVHTVQYG